MNRWDYVGLVFLAMIIGLSAFGLSRVKTNTEDVLQWLPDQSDARVDYNFFKRNFGSDDFVILTWNGCTTDDPRLQQFAELMRSGDPSGLILKVTTGYDVTRELGEQLNLPKAAIVRRLQGVFFGLEDEDLTCAVVELSHAGTGRRTAAMQLIRNAIEQTDQLEINDISMAGYPYIATYIDEQLLGSYRQLLLPSVVLATLIALFCLRDFRLGLIVFVTAVGAATASIALTPAVGSKLGGLMSIIPALVFVLATSGSIHLIRYSLDAIGNPAKLLSIGWRPCVISTATTAVGMLSLTRSEFPAIRNFGFFCAAGVGFALAFQLAVVPWLLLRFGQPGLMRLARLSSESSAWMRLIEIVERQRWPVALLFVGLTVAGIVGLTRLRAEVEVEKLFRSDSEIIQSLVRMEERLAPMDQTEVLLVFDDSARDRMHQRAAYTNRVQSELSQIEDVQVAYSLVNFLPREPKIRSARDFVRRSAYHDFLDRERDRLADGGLLAIDPETGKEIWRISVRFPFTRQMDFEKIRSQVEAATLRVAEQYDPSVADAPAGSKPAPNFTPPKFVYTGHTYLFHHAQLTLLKDLFQNFLLAFAIITPMLIVVLRSLKLGLIAMLPNIFPTVVVFGGLGWVGFRIDLALAMTACVALGIAVDDTTHFLVRFRDFGGSLANVSRPIRRAMAQCGPAMFHTTLIASASLLTYSFSKMLVVSRFSWAISTLLAVALLADVLMLPAILLLLRRGTDAAPLSRFSESDDTESDAHSE